MGAIVSWLATKYAWKCRDARVKGSTRLVLLAIALLVKKNYISTVPTALTRLQRLTFLSDDSVRRCLDTLEEVGEIRRMRRGKRAIYAIVRMAGPLFTETPQDAVFFDQLKSPQDAGFQNRKMRGSAPGRRSGDISSEFVRTKVLTTTTEERAVAVFLGWFLGEFPKHRHGALYTVQPAAAEKVVAELLGSRSVERLQAMALRMWAEHDEPWIAASDYSLHVLKHRAAWLESRLPVERQAWRCDHLDRCSHRSMCDDKHTIGPARYPLRQDLEAHG